MLSLESFKRTILLENACDLVVQCKAGYLMILDSLSFQFCLFPEAVIRRCSSKQVFLKISQISPMLESLFNKAAGFQTCNFIIKETPTQVDSCEYCKMFQNSFFIERLLPHSLGSFCYWYLLRKKAGSNKTLALTKSMSMDILGSWYIKSTLYKRFLN